MLSRRSILTAGAMLPVIASMGKAQVQARLRIGDAEIVSLSDGQFQVGLAPPVKGIAAESVTKAFAEAGQVPSGVSVLNVTLMKQGDDITLFDCGSGPNFLPGTGLLGKSLEAAGFAPDKVKRVVFTHLHPDHLWGALDDFDTPLFANATYHIAERELDFWRSKAAYDVLPEDRHMFVAGAQRILKGLDGQIKTFKPGQEVHQGIMAHDTAGHSAGHVSFEVRQGNEAVMVLGDAMTHGLLSFAYPQWEMGMDQDAAQAVLTRQSLLGRLAAEKLAIIGYHLPAGGMGRVEKAGSAYRLVSL